MQPFEQSSDMLEKHPVAATLTREFPAFAAGQQDAVKRLQSLELESVKHADGLAAVQKKLGEVDQHLNALATDRTALQKRQEAVEAVPAQHAERVGILEKTVAMLHGAVAALGRNQTGTPAFDIADLPAPDRAAAKAAVEARKIEPPTKK